MAWEHSLEAASETGISQSTHCIAVVVQLLSCVWLFVTSWTAARQASLSLTISQSLLKLMCFESMMPSNHFILCCPLVLLPWIFASINELVLCIRWQSIGASASASVLPKTIQGWFPLGWTGLIWTCSINMLLQKRSQMCHIHTLANLKKSHCAMRRGEQNGSSGRDPTTVLPSALRSRPKWWWPSCKAQTHALINWWKESPYS